MMKLSVAGAAGRMGMTILGLAQRDPKIRIVSAIEASEHVSLGRDVGEVMGEEPLGIRIGDDPVTALKSADVLIDFTHFSTTDKHLKAALKTKTGLVIGTTGLKDKTLRAIRTASRRIPIVQAPNMSVGVNLLFKLSQMVAEVLDENYDIEIVEAHHRMKKDAPSGTALKLVDVLAAARGRNPKKDVVYGRQGETGERPKGEISVLAMRGGDVVGDHHVGFLGDGERIELVHRASSREAFAQGALRAAKFVAARKSGLFGMQKVLGID